MTNVGDARIVLTCDGRIGVLELTGRDGVNAMDERFVTQLAHLVDNVETAVDERRIDVLVIKALGRHFCVGGDVSHFAQAGDASTHMARMASFAHRAIAALHGLDIPVIAQWQGAAAGGGIGLVLAADVVIAARSASMTAGYAAVGLTPDAGVSWGLSKRVGPSRALELLLSNRRVGTEELVSLGLVTRVVDEEQLEEETRAFATRLLKLDGDTARATKRLIRDAAGATLRTHLDVEADTIATQARGERFRSVIDASQGGVHAG